MSEHKKTLHQFHQDIGWSTRIYVLLALTVVMGALIFRHWGLTIAFALALVLLVEGLALSIQRHPATWRVIGWWLLLIGLALLLIGLS